MKTKSRALATPHSRTPCFSSSPFSSRSAYQGGACLLRRPRRVEWAVLGPRSNRCLISDFHPRAADLSQLRPLRRLRARPHLGVRRFPSTIALPFCLLWRIGAKTGGPRAGEIETFALLDSSPILLRGPALIAGAAIHDVDGAVVGLAVAMIGSGVVIATWLLRTARTGPDLSPPGGARSYLGFGLPYGVRGNLPRSSTSGPDLVLVGAIVGAAAGAAFIRSRYQLLSIAWTLMAAFAISAPPRSARLQAHSERELIDLSDRHESDARTTRHTVPAIPPMGIAILALILAGIPIFYGTEFHRSVELAAFPAGFPAARTRNGRHRDAPRRWRDRPGGADLRGNRPGDCRRLRGRDTSGWRDRSRNRG